MAKRKFQVGDIVRPKPTSWVYKTEGYDHCYGPNAYYEVLRYDWNGNYVFRILHKPLPYPHHQVYLHASNLEKDVAIPEELLWE